MEMTIVKLDLCGSKRFFDQHRHRANIRQKTLAKLTQASTEIFPNGHMRYPMGSLYATQGDCVYYILADPTTAVRCTIDFLRKWEALTDALPDCRAVVDAGVVGESPLGDRTELTSSAFENISVIEAHYGAGEIGVTERVKTATNPSLVNFIGRRETTITEHRSVTSWIANYENPRLLSDSSLVHALFVASPKSTTVRARTYEALIVECVMETAGRRASLTQIQEAIREKQCPVIDVPQLNDIVNESEHLVSDGNYVELAPIAEGSFETIRRNFQRSRDSFVKRVAERFADRIKLRPEVIETRLDIAALLERYICAVFLEFRSMAAYMVNTVRVIDDLSSDFDHIIVQALGKSFARSDEKFMFFKRAFLDSIKEAIDKESVYVASVFHNVLMLYYLNRNERYIHEQVATIRTKRIYFDTNTLYAYMCHSSEHHSLVAYCVEKLGVMGVRPIVFDRSVQEYNESISSVAANVGQMKHLRSALEYDPWILQEYETNRAAYSHNLGYCIEMHRIPAGDKRDTKEVSEVESELLEKGMLLEILDPYMNATHLGAIYQHVYDAKQVFDPEVGGLVVRGNLDTYHDKVLHDANCLRRIANEGQTPYELEKMFVTCDYRLAKVRRMHIGYDCVVTIKEFYEFMMPSLLLSDTISSDPVEIPRFLLASAISVELAATRTLESVVGDFLASSGTVRQDYRILARNENRGRLEEIRAKINSGEDGSAVDPADLGRAVGAYRDAVREEVGRSMVSDEIRARDECIAKLEGEVDIVTNKLERERARGGRRRRYERAQRRREGS